MKTKTLSDVADELRASLHDVVSFDATLMDNGELRSAVFAAEWLTVANWLIDDGDAADLIDAYRMAEHDAEA